MPGDRSEGRGRIYGGTHHYKWTSCTGFGLPQKRCSKVRGEGSVEDFHPKLDGRDLEDIPRIPMAMPGYDNRKEEGIGKTAPRIGAVFCFANSQY